MMVLNNPLNKHLQNIGENWNIDFFVMNSLSKGDVLVEFGLAAYVKFKIGGLLNIDIKCFGNFLRHT